LWAKNSTHFRRVALAARDFLAIPGGSIPSERAFSAAVRLVTHFSTSLAHYSIQAHVCLSSRFHEHSSVVKDVGEEYDSSEAFYMVVDESSK
jgi:hypothetical protein